MKNQFLILILKMSILSEHTITLKNETITTMSISNSAINPFIAICTTSRVILYND